MTYPVKAKVAGKWFDRARGMTHEVKPGDVAEFGAFEDAAYFVSAGVAEHATADTSAPVKDTSDETVVEIKPAKGRKQA